MGRNESDAKPNQRYPRKGGCGMIVINPNIIVREKVIIIMKSILLSFSLPTIDTVKKMSRGPQDIHSPHRDAGVATLRWKTSALFIKETN